MEPVQKYHPLLRALHWFMALCIIGLLAVGLYMTSLPRDLPLRADLYALHKSFGVTVLVLAFIRVALRMRLGAPALPSVIPAIERLMAHLGHTGLYFFMFALPLSGIIMSNSFGFAVKWFGVELPRIIGIDKDRGHMAEEAHELMAYLLIGLIALHVAGALKHLIKEKLNLFKRMM